MGKTTGKLTNNLPHYPLDAPTPPKTTQARPKTSSRCDEHATWTPLAGMVVVWEILAKFAEYATHCGVQVMEEKARPPHHKAVIPSMKRRMGNHDYSAPCFYMITVSIAHNSPKLASVTGQPFKDTGFSIPEYDLTRGPSIKLTPAGMIVQSELYALEQRFPVKISNSVIMPDHIHFIIKVTETYPKKLGNIIGAFKGKCTSAFWDRYPHSVIAQGRMSLWETGFNDKVVYNGAHLPRYVHYVLENPRRYLIRKLLPDYFYHKWAFDALGESWHAVGNIFLLDHPIREVIRFSRHSTATEWEERKNILRASARNGEVIVSTFIHPEEREITRECTRLGAKLIWIKTDGFPQRSVLKGDTLYSLCAQGRLLMVAPAVNRYTTQTVTRQQCLTLNFLALHIAQTAVIPIHL